MAMAAPNRFICRARFSICVEGPSTPLTWYGRVKAKTPKAIISKAPSASPKNWNIIVREAV